MSRPALYAILLTGVFAAAFSGIFSQRSLLNELRGEAQRLRSSSAETASAAPATAPDAISAPPSRDPANAAVPAELLQLRNQVSRLNEERRSLASVKAENERLRSSLAAAKTNPPAGGLPPGYIRMSTAQFAGHATPEATLQTFLWALHEKNIDQLLQTLTPESAAELQKHFKDQNPDEMFKGAEALPGMGIVERQDAGDGTLDMKLQPAPDMPSMPVKFRLVLGEWKMEMPH